MVRQTGSNMSMPSKLRTKPAPRDIHTENFSVLRGANLGSDTCLYLKVDAVSNLSPSLPINRKGIDRSSGLDKTFYVPSESKDAPVQAPEPKVEPNLSPCELLLQ